MEIVIIHWRIKPGVNNSDMFLADWSRKFKLDKRSNLVAEFLSGPLTKDEVDFDCKTFDESPDYTSFFTVGLWRDAASFKADVYDRIAKDRKLEDYEYGCPERMVLRPLNWRRGELTLPESDHLR
jgi:hypothetical protein